MPRSRRSAHQGGETYPEPGDDPAFRRDRRAADRTRDDERQDAERAPAAGDADEMGERIAECRRSMQLLNSWKMSAAASAKMIVSEVAISAPNSSGDLPV